MQIFILRHGEAGFDAVRDRDRELTANGVRSSRDAARFCATAGLSFTHLFASPLRRAQQTAESFIEFYPSLTLQTKDFLLPDADPDSVLRELVHFTNDARILLVTHEPFASTCISAFIHGHDPVRIAMRTTSLACIETDGIITRGSGRLIWLLTSELMGRLQG